MPGRDGTTKVSPLPGRSELVKHIGNTVDQAVSFPDHAVAIKDENVRLPKD